jgi:outer membrane protein
MKQLSLLLSVVGLGLGATALVLQLTAGKKNKAASVTNDIRKQESTTADNSFRIAYFEMDSLESNFVYFKRAKEEITDKERSLTASFAALQKSFQQKAAALNQQRPTSQQEMEEMQAKVIEMERKLKEKRDEIDQQLYEFRNNKLKEIRTKIENFLKEYNKDKRYAYIFTYEQGFIYSRDTTYDITNDLLNGLNAIEAKASKK